MKKTFLRQGPEIGSAFKYFCPGASPASLTVRYEIEKRLRAVYNEAQCPKTYLASIKAICFASSDIR